MPKVRILSGRNAGAIVDMPVSEAENNVSTGFGEIVADERKPPAAPGVNATDGAVALAAEIGLDLALVTGTGAGGRITVKDVRAVIPGGAGG